MSNRWGIDMILIKIKMNNNSIIHFISLYNPPNRTGFPKNFWNRFFERCSTFDRIITAGDFNAHSPHWSNTCDTPDRMGSFIEEALVKHNLVCLNDGSATWAAGDLSCRSALDLTIVSPNLSTGDWKTHAYNLGSDHYPIISSWNNVNLITTSCRPSYSTFNVKWDKYSSSIDNNLNPAPNHQNTIESEYSHFCVCLHNAITFAGGKDKTSNKLTRGSPIWWNSDCDVAIKEKRRAYSTFCDNPSIFNYDNFIKTSKESPQKLKKDKK